MRHNERGSGPIMAILVMGFIALVAAAGLVGVGTVARGERSEAQTAADAAALAGAGWVLDDLPGQLTNGTFSGDQALQDGVDQPGCLQLGQIDAHRLALANGATLISYCWTATDDEVSVTVRLNHSDKGEPAEASAQAETGFNVDDCAIDSGFTPPTSPPQPPVDDQDGKQDGKKGDKDKDPPKPAKPQPVQTTLDCGFGAVQVRYDPEQKTFTFVDPSQLAGQLSDLKPRLTK